MIIISFQVVPILHYILIGHQQKILDLEKIMSIKSQLTEQQEMLVLGLQTQFIN